MSLRRGSVTNNSCVGSRSRFLVAGRRSFVNSRRRGENKNEAVGCDKGFLV